MNHNVELLAPAGNFEKLKFAFHYGADAVYCSGKRFGLRAFAGNFSDEELKEAINYTHLIGKKIYITLNMYPHNKDMKDIEDYLLYLANLKPDAFLVADPGVYRIIQNLGINIPIHISTQATIVNWADILFWEDHPNVERVVLARELSLEEIEEIRSKTSTELEIFVHGAMCMSYSGRCLLSNYMTGRDANKGECAQPCRWNYSIVEEKRPGEYYPIEEDEHGSYIFNSYDLCTLEKLELILASHINSLKIEGRMKSIFYVSTIIRCYRNIIDSYKKDGRVDSDELNYWLAELDKVSHRPYTTGFLFGKPEDNALNNTTSGYIKPYDFIGVVKSFNTETNEVIIEQRNKISIGDIIQFFGREYKEYNYTVEEMFDENNQLIESAPHAQQLIKMRIPFSVDVMDLIRKKL